ncbi:MULTISPECIES: hypothetical protein [Prochlorococcus]|uniref:hypothetical protein n=1 Tax=Prochlorococcus TaxID=1218 RepID=UPI0007B3435B|nr:hypothetical protein [Prochlorococcus marinus]
MEASFFSGQAWPRDSSYRDLSLLITGDQQVLLQSAPIGLFFLPGSFFSSHAWLPGSSTKLDPEDLPTESFFLPRSDPTEGLFPDQA